MNKIKDDVKRDIVEYIDNEKKMIMKLNKLNINESPFRNGFKCGMEYAMMLIKKI